MLVVLFRSLGNNFGWERGKCWLKFYEVLRGWYVILNRVEVKDFRVKNKERLRLLK